MKIELLLIKGMREISILLIFKEPLVALSKVWQLKTNGKLEKTFLEEKDKVV